MSTVRPPLFRRLPCWEAHTNKPVTCWFGYDPADPYAVTLTFEDEHGETYPWLMARQLLVDGQTGHAGDGPVKVWPRWTWRHKFVVLKLISRDGQVVYEFHRGDLGWLLDAADRMVPAGCESAQATRQVDAAIVDCNRHLASLQLVSCPDCGRRFASDRIGRHAKRAHGAQGGVR